MPPRGNMFPLHQASRQIRTSARPHMTVLGKRVVRAKFILAKKLDRVLRMRSKICSCGVEFTLKKSTFCSFDSGCFVAYGFHTESFNSFIGLKRKIHDMKKLVFGYLFEFRVRRPARAAVSPVAPQPISASRLRAQRGLATSHSAQPIRNYLIAEDGYEC